MELTLLIDLDDTLLITNLDDFIHEYFQAFNKHVISYGFKPGFIEQIIESTGCMINNKSPKQTLKEVFDASFYPALENLLPPHLKNSTKNADGLSAVENILFEFYEKIFPGLRAVTQPRPQSKTFIEQVVRRGWHVTIATNPLFPQTATLQRLGWAGFPIHDFPFELVSTYENFHFTKPHPTYYAEILSQMGWREGGVLMIGNELHDDIEAALQLGLATFWIKPNGEALIRGNMKDPSLKPTAQGDLTDVLEWIDDQPLGALQPKYTTPLSWKSILLSTPAALQTLTRSLKPKDWENSVQPSEWSPVEILCHWRDIEEEVYLPRLQQILKEDEPHWKNIPSETWAVQRRYKEQNGSSVLDSFTNNRLRTLSLINGLEELDWQRSAYHPTDGKVSLAELIQRVVRHDQEHVRQLKKSLLEAH